MDTANRCLWNETLLVSAIFVPEGTENLGSSSQKCVSGLEKFEAEKTFFQRSKSFWSWFSWSSPVSKNFEKRHYQIVSISPTWIFRPFQVVRNCFEFFLFSEPRNSFFDRHQLQFTHAQFSVPIDIQSDRITLWISMMIRTKQLQNFGCVKTFGNWSAIFINQKAVHFAWTWPLPSLFWFAIGDNIRLGNFQ